MPSCIWIGPIALAEVHNFNRKERLRRIQPNGLSFLKEDSSCMPGGERTTLPLAASEQNCGVNVKRVGNVTACNLSGQFNKADVIVVGYHSAGQSTP